MDVQELEHRPATTCTPDTPLADVARLMRKDNVGSVVVTDAHGRLAGIVTDRDIVVHAIAESMDPSTPVERVMTRDVEYLYEDADVLSAANAMAGNGYRRLPVLDNQGHLTGVVSFDDLVVTFSDQLERLGRAVRTEMHAGRIA